jgi:hypothetical protein
MNIKPSTSCTAELMSSFNDTCTEKIVDQKKA